MGEYDRTTFAWVRADTWDADWARGVFGDVYSSKFIVGKVQLKNHHCVNGRRRVTYKLQFHGDRKL